MFIYLLSTDGLSKINPLTFSSWKGNSPDRTKQSAVTGVKELHEHFLRAKRELHKVHHQGDGHNLKIKGGKKLECLAKWPVVKLHILGLNKNKNSRRVVLLNCSWPFIEKYAHHDKKNYSLTLFFVTYLLFQRLVLILNIPRVSHIFLYWVIPAFPFSSWTPMMPLSGIYSLLEAPPTCHLNFICEGQPIVRKLA